MAEVDIINGQDTVSGEYVEVTRELTANGDSLVGEIAIQPTTDGPIRLRLTEEFLEELSVDSVGFKAEGMPDDQQVSADQLVVEHTVEDEPATLVYGVSLAESVGEVDAGAPVIDEETRGDEVDADADEEPQSEESSTQAAGGAARSVDARLDHLSARVEEVTAYSKAMQEFLDSRHPDAERVDAIEADVDNLDDRLDQTHDELSSEISSVREELQTVSEQLEDLAGMQEDVEALSEEVTDLNSMRESLIAALTAGRDADDAVADLDGTSDEAAPASEPEDSATDSEPEPDAADASTDDDEQSTAVAADSDSDSADDADDEPAAEVDDADEEPATMEMESGTAGPELDLESDGGDEQDADNASPKIDLDQPDDEPGTEPANDFVRGASRRGRSDDTADIDTADDDTVAAALSDVDESDEDDEDDTIDL